MSPYREVYQKAEWYGRVSWGWYYIPWPDVAALAEYRRHFPDTRLVLQLTRHTVSVAGNIPQGVVERLQPYIGLIDDILFDPSGGGGQAFDPEAARVFLTAIAEQHRDIGLGVAGGLGPDSLSLVQPLLSEFPDINIDVEGKVRVPETDRMDIQAMRQYLEGAFNLLTN